MELLFNQNNLNIYYRFTYIILPHSYRNRDNTMDNNNFGNIFMHQMIFESCPRSLVLGILEQPKV
jgi:hypothetical protein